jgi:hypothetical protein
VPNEPAAGWVIDGQPVSRERTTPIGHRASGGRLLALDVKEQTSFFVTINREQKGVPSCCNTSS